MGPAYGKPGYKESHNWEKDSDLFAPVVFDWKFYQAMYDTELADMSEAQVRQYWVETANADAMVYPDCNQASSQFSMNMYYRANPGLESTTGGVCKMIVEDYLNNGIYDGKPTALSAAEKTYSDSLSADELAAYVSSAKGKARAQKLRQGGSETRGNILLYGDNSPKISTAANHGKYLEVVSAQ